jgi:cytochrome c biogenesis protein CcdA/thiol-disulfide isomerase/thioredoxin
VDLILLLGIGFLAGLITSLTPCVLPVLPVLLAGGATGRKPLRIIAGLVASFVVFTLFAAWLLDSLGLPQDLLRNLAIAMLFLVAATLLVPRLAQALERPFAGLTRFRAGGGGFMLGASLGLVFVPCAGPVLAAVTSLAAKNDVNAKAFLLLLAYALGAAIPMLLVAYGGREFAGRLRAHAGRLRIASGVAIAAVALAFTFNLETRAQEVVPPWLNAFQDRVESSKSAQDALDEVTGRTALVAKPAPAPGTTAALPDYGVAPGLKPGGDWFNSEPLTLRGLRGKVVLIDFWTYSCINCIRTLPHLKAWDATYRDRGLVIVGVHAPEFAFEHVSSNVRDAIARFGIEYPVVQDNDFGTWDNYQNQYWPAKYLIDRKGHVRYVHFGEGSYDETEAAIRSLLGAGDVAETDVVELKPSGTNTPESYLGYERIFRYAGTPIRRDRLAGYAFPKGTPQVDTLSYDGKWRVEAERIVAGDGARLRLRFHARDVFLVLGGKGDVSARFDGRLTKTVAVDGYRLYTLRRGPRFLDDSLLELRFTPGVQAYAFTFG